MKKKKAHWRDRADFCFIALTKDGKTARQYFADYDDMYCFASFWRSSENIVSARGMQLIRKNWIELFRI